ncbi:hypothetical protein FB45DRAFT_302592 [Roridomyces roridus]|uniref:F-box domain-containing protein n=1 Tax=Roridomyces roridus TaxID=1738132 RepID=A0AAD7B760_9AGAR|nr:hypothetical protein FB45DRAFT_302592 [Roridomyces roridus]
MRVGHTLRQRLSDLDSSILRHESILRELAQERCTVLADLKLIVYPILTLPSEITLDVFKWCATDTYFSPRSAPLLLAQVCHDWRALACSTPTLWDSIHRLYFEEHPTADTIVERWFSRAGTRPLSLDIACAKGCNVPRVRSIILRHAPQFGFLRLVGTPEVLTELWAGVHSLPILSSLELDCLCLDDTDESTQLFRIDDAPTLRQLCLQRALPSMITLPWGQLTKLTLISIPIGECLHALRGATSLQEFEYGGVPPHQLQFISNLTPSSEPISHSTLENLIISLPEEDQGILPFLTLPSLRQFSLGSRFGGAAHSLDDVAVMLLRVSSTLRTFTVTPDTMIPVLAFRPLTELITLELSWAEPGRFMRDIVRALNRSALPDFLPKLQYLVLSDCPSDMVDQDLLDALDSRLGDATHTVYYAKIESFTLVWPPMTSFIDRQPLVNAESLRALAERGMHVHVGTRDVNRLFL